MWLPSRRIHGLHCKSNSLCVKGWFSGMDSYQELKNSGTADKFSGTSTKNVLHFSDGILEVNSGTESHDITSNQTPVNPQELSWAPWVWHYTVFAGVKALQVCDYFGEFLATFFGITTPKYQYEISEYNRIKREEEDTCEEGESVANCWIQRGTLNEHIHNSERPNFNECQLQIISTIEQERKL